MKFNTELSNWLSNRLNRNLSIDEWQRDSLVLLLKTLKP